MPQSIKRSVFAGDAAAKIVTDGGTRYGYVPTSMPAVPNAKSRRHW